MKISVITFVISLIIFIAIWVGIILFIKFIFKCFKGQKTHKSKRKEELDKMNIEDL